MGKVIVETYYPGQIRSDVQAESTICRNCGHILVWQKIAIPPRWGASAGRELESSPALALDLRVWVKEY